MAKRLTDTDKWKDEWYVSLHNDYKIIWQWLLDNCNHAGICKRSTQIINIMCKTSVSEEEILRNMCGRLIIINNDWFIPNFIKFQYTSLHSEKPVIVSVRNELFKTGYFKLIPESFGNDYLIIKDKDKDKDKDKGINNDQKSDNGKITNKGSNFKARGEEVLIEQRRKNLEAAERDRQENNKSKEKQ